MAPGAQLVNQEQYRQARLAQMKLCPAADTFEPVRYELQLLRAYGVQQACPPPQTFVTPPPPQVWPSGQFPHSSVPPQPSGMLPQSFPCAAQVVGVHDPPPA